VKLSSVLLFPLVFFFITQYSLSWGKTPFWLFTLIFLGLLAYISLDLIKLKESTYNRLKSIALWVLIFLAIGSGFFSSVISRHKTAPVYGVHDIILQQEAAIRFVLHGKNPYKETYFGTPMESWHYSDTEVNPALYHFVMEPFYLILALPFYFAGNFFFGFSDARIPLYLLMFLSLIVVWVVVKDEEKKRLFVTLLAFNPVMLPYTLEGRSDFFMFAFLISSFYLLQKNKSLLGGILMGLAFAVKQSAWPIFPFYVAYLFFKTKKVKKTLLNLTPFLTTFLVLTLPFFFWDPKAFLDSTVFYLSGSGSHSYPVSGYGLGMLLNEWRFLPNLKTYYPFIIWQIIICLPLAVLLIKFQKQSNNVRRLILVYAIFLFVYWYLSRYFNNSHMGYLSMVFITAYFWPEDKLHNRE